MSIQPFSQPRIKFLDPVRFDSPYRLPIFAITMSSGFWIGKYVARYCILCLIPFQEKEAI
ncbi:hypothetical protein [Candidatus Rhabdochlamydia porcellionis]|jgi:hypothetical protein|uniref:Uncharacterized protein n=1 Tax=Candidatus Rhabdochlamydia porcellionis TaxID=225148 RepID=A0ABX8Z3W5_9BACT|nr:hypothetical protein [Candidatus Rhabdochlamydia porcellionis]QZA59013.1 hypothetical protein RHAB15C_0000897 [Candidatus Rhabdochlamydia porcellionis]